MRSFFRFSRFRTTLEDMNLTPNQSRLFPNPNGGAMHALNVSGDLVWTIDPRTVLNVSSNYISNNDDYDAPEQYATLANYKEFFPNATDFYTRYLDFGAPFYYPGHYHRRRQPRRRLREGELVVPASAGVLRRHQDLPPGGTPFPEGRL